MEPQPINQTLKNGTIITIDNGVIEIPQPTKTYIKESLLDKKNTLQIQLTNLQNTTSEIQSELTDVNELLGFI